MDAGRALTRRDIQAAFEIIGDRARARGLIIDLAVYGGSALVLVTDWRVSTRDIDAVPFGDPAAAASLVDEVGRELGLPEGWLNDGVRTYLSPRDDPWDGAGERPVRLLRGYPDEAAPGLRVFVPTPDYLLAMKLMARRAGPDGARDLSDISWLARETGIAGRDALLDLAASFYPEARASPRIATWIEEIADALAKPR